MKKYFIALEPDRELSDKIIAQKKQVFNGVGEQGYLSDPPHFTIVVFTSEKEEKLREIFVHNFAKLEKMKITIKNLHIFRDDVLTGGHTIIYNLSEKDVNFLKSLQKNVVEAIAPVNSKKLILENSNQFKNMSEVEQKNVMAHGFPFVGDIWIPHITIASIEKIKFEEALKIVKEKEITGNFILEFISLYEISDSVKLIKKIKLK